MQRSTAVRHPLPLHAEPAGRSLRSAVMASAGAFARQAALALGVMLAAASACERDLDGAPCPCADGYVCCTSSNTCERELAQCAPGASHGAPAGGAADARSTGPDAASPSAAAGAAEGGGPGAGGPAGAGGTAGAGGLDSAASAGPPALPRDAGTPALEALDAAPAEPPASGSGEATPGAEADAGSCASIVFCDAPGGEGTVCLQEACSIARALDDCVEDSYFVCGAPSTPWLLRALDGSELSVPLDAGSAL